MPRRRSPRRTVRRRPSGGSVDSRWWYWVAAIPAVFVFWFVAVAWVSVAVALGPLADARPVLQAAEISLVAFGVPFLVLTVVFPFAVYADASAIIEAELDWRPPRTRLTVAATLGPIVAAAALLYGLVAGSSMSVPLWAVVAGFLLAVPVAAYYLYHRHGRLGVP